MVTARHTGISALAFVVATPMALLLPVTGWAELEEIVVSARRRDELLEDVPISITAFTQEGLRQRNIQNAYDLAEFTPNFTLTRNIGRRLDSPNIRGQFAPLVGTAPNASFFVDGVFLSGTVGSLSIPNLERVEILRGPQAALFGRATFAGAVNYITRQPTNEFEGEIEGRYGEDDDVQSTLWVSGPIVEDKAYYFASYNYQGWDGEWRNGLQPGEVNSVTIGAPFSGYTWAPNVPKTGSPCPAGSAGDPVGCAPTDGDYTKVGGESNSELTLKMVLTPIEPLEITLKYGHVETDDDHFASLYVPPSDLNCRQPQYDPANQIYIPSPGWFCGELKPGSYVTKVNIPNMRQGVSTSPVSGASQIFTSAPAGFIGSRDEVHRYSAKAALDLGEWQAITTYTDSHGDFEQYRDLDRTPALGPVAVGLFEMGEKPFYDDKSFEFRLTSPGDNRYRGLLGYYYYNKDGGFSLRSFNGFASPGADTTFYYLSSLDYATNNAVFGTFEVDLTDKTTVTLDGRYAKDEVSQERGDRSVRADEIFYSFTPRGTIRYDFNESVNAYLQIAKGNKPGGWNFAYFDTDVAPGGAEAAIENGDAVIEEEEDWVYEIGSKSRFFDDTLSVNAAFFYIDWTNQSLNVFDCIELRVGGCELNNVVANAGKSEVWGTELEISWQANDYWFFNMAWGWADTTLLEYYDPELASLTCNQWAWLQNPTVNVDCSAAGDANGKKAPRVPEHTVSLNATYTRPLVKDISWFLRNDFIFESKKYGTVANLEHTGEAYIWNSRVGLQAERWTVTAYVDNLLDEDSPYAIQDFPLFDNSQVQRIDPNNQFSFYRAPGGLTNEGAYKGDIVYPSTFQLDPRRSRNVGITASYRFGGE